VPVGEQVTDRGRQLSDPVLTIEVEVDVFAGGRSADESGEVADGVLVVLQCEADQQEAESDGECGD
jgi:hypothetical protein